MAAISSNARRLVIEPLPAARKGQERATDLVTAGWGDAAYLTITATVVLGSPNHATPSCTMRHCGAFESDYLMLIRHAQGRLTCIELFELGELDAALARFAVLRPSLP